MRQSLSIRRTTEIAAAVAALGIVAGCGAARPTENAVDRPGDGGGTTRLPIGSSDDSGVSDPGDAGSSSSSGSVQQQEAGPPPPDPCAGDGGCPAGEWIDVTPASINLVDMLDCSNYGTKSIQVDPARPQDMYTLFFCQGVWKSSDYGQTWTGPINTGMNGATMGDCAGGITVSRGANGGPPNVFASCIRGNGLGFWRSTNGGVDWQEVTVPVPSADNQQFYPPEVDPYDPNHLLMVGHGENLLVESTDGGQTWTQITLNPYMMQNGGTGGINFVNTGDATTTRGTWLYLTAQAPPLTSFPPGETSTGTWRTTDEGQTWTFVDMNEHPIGSAQIYQPDTMGVVYMAGLYSASGWGVLRSTDYGATWTHVGPVNQETIVFGTPKNVYAMFGGGGPGEAAVNSELMVAPQPGIDNWTMPGTPMAMTYAPARAAVTNDGKNSIIVVAAYNSGVWRYIEP